MEITKETQEFIFKVATDKASPAGTHKGIFCYVTIPQNGEEILHRAGSTQFRVDKPLPPPVTKKEEPKKPRTQKGSGEETRTTQRETSPPADPTRKAPPGSREATQRGSRR